MKINAIIALLALLSAPLSAAAQQAPPKPPAGAPHWSRANTAATRGFMQKERALHDQARANILNALSPAHRAAVARIVGNLAVAAKPNLKGAISQIDATLTSGEKNAVLSAQRSYMQSEKSLHDQMLAQITSKMTAAQKARMQSMRSKMQARQSKMRSAHPRRAPDAGAIVLRTALGGIGGRPGFGGPRRFGGPMRRAPMHS